jgi:hypothetical protein
MTEYTLAEVYPTTYVVPVDRANAPHKLDSASLINPVAVPAIPASVAQAPPYPPQTWAQPRTMVKWVGLGLLLGVLAALPKPPPPRRGTAICRHCGSAHMPGGLGRPAAWSA